MNLLITICARGGSKGIPGKNVRLINGTPLIAYSVKHALEYAKKTGADVALTTDSDDIKKVAADAGLVTDYTRPPELSTDSASKLETIRHLVFATEEKNGKKYDMALDLDVTSPLRTVEDLDAARKMMEAQPDAHNLFSVSFPKHNPYFDMIEKVEGSPFVSLVKVPEKQMSSRQQGPRVFELNASFYYYRRIFFEQDPMILVRNSLAYEMPHMCFELDEMIDFNFLDYVLKEKKLDFHFA